MELSSGDTAFMLFAAAVVLFMTPGLALFYGGLSRSKSVLNMMLMSFAALGVVSILWVLYGYSIAFGATVDVPGIGTGFFGNPFDKFAMSGVFESDADGNKPISGTVPEILFAAFQMMFAVLTVALISGAIADRVKFGSWVLFVGLWATFVYFPVCHMVFELDNGVVASRIGALDFAGGTAVHINSGVAALVLAFVVGKRRGFGRDPMRPHNVPLVLLGASILFLGWFGFNAGSQVAADGVSGLAFFNTMVAAASAAVAWIGVEKLRDGHATVVGAASGVVAGLVGITPACDTVTPLGAIAIGLIAGGACALAVTLKNKAKMDDSLDVVGIHFVGGLLGTLLIGFLAAESANGTNGLLYGGGLDQYWAQLGGAALVIVYSGVVTTVLALLIKVTVGWRVSDEDEMNGIDSALHAESAYDLGNFGGGGSTSVLDAATGTSSATVASSTKGA